MRLRLITLLLTSLLLTATVGSARAALLGDVLKPFVSVTEVYDSNVFRVKDRDQLRLQNGDDRLDDFTTIVSVGSGLHYSLSKQELNLLLKRDFIRYIHYSDQDADRDLASLSLALNVLDKVRINLDGAYSKSPQSHNDYQGQGLNEVTNLSGGITLGYVMVSGLGFEASYHRDEVGYSLAQYRVNEYSADRYSGRVTYRMSPLTMIYVGLQRDVIDYQEGQSLGAASLNNDNTGDSVRVGVERGVGGKTTVSGYIGYLQRRHKSGAVKDFDGVIGKVALGYKLSDRLGLSLNGERQLNEETYVGRIYSVSESLGLGLLFQLTPSIKINLSDRLVWKNFEDLPGSGVPKRSDFLYELNAGIGWSPINRLSVDIGYTYSNRSSDDSTQDYDDHTLLTSLSYRF